MHKFLRTLFIGLLLAGSAAAQGDQLQEAREAYSENDLTKAKSIIDAAASDENLAKNYETWFLKGTIYKALYKANEKGKQFKSANRDISVEAYKKSMDLGAEANQDDMNSVRKSLKFIASTYYNDAVLGLEAKMSADYEQAVSNFESYMQITTLLDPSTDLTAQNVKFKMKLATIYVALYEENASNENGEKYFKLAKEEYHNIIEMNKAHLSANYNLGILFYNKAVHIIQSMEYDIDLETLSQKEEVCVELFLKALPYITAAYDMDPKRRETLISLKGIYYSLNDMEKYDRYKKELDELNN